MRKKQEATFLGINEAGSRKFRYTVAYLLFTVFAFGLLIAMFIEFVPGLIFLGLLIWLWIYTYRRDKKGRFY